ncbi:hypothetical protein ANN_22553 [Periplaneta americana]|uniref:Mos1 transposase HTH domain-containing protein n=1 Tax=Periplaneta americana TaxID=6978 RepID=A0ABQ8S8S3_PERAM|nr:hypothetical protein ANN_22553 [Periplaneta americana]
MASLCECGNEPPGSLKARKTAAETVGMLPQAFNDDALGKSQVYEWFSRFTSGNMSTEDMPRPERPSTGRNDENMPKSNVQLIKIVERPLTKFLSKRTYDQRENRVRVCRDLKSEVQNDPNFLKRIVIGDESWCYGYDPESKQASSQWKTPNSPRPKKAR